MFCINSSSSSSGVVGAGGVGGGVSGAGGSGAGSSNSNTDPKRVGTHPLKSFSVPAPPSSAPTTPQQRHVGM